VEVIFSRNPSDLYDAQASLGLLLLLGLTFSATGSFRQELETGAFELLLVTPLRERQIVAGRLRGLWRQFLPAILVYGCGSIYLASGWSDREVATTACHAVASTLASFCTLPLIGLYFSMRRWNFFPAWLVASLLGLLPVVLGRAIGVTNKWIISLQFVVAISAAALLLRRLQDREFLQKTL
jgi:ABC-type transport system involved in cytochrome c biogenesis permease component